MDKGWIKLHRAILENAFLMHDERAFVVFMKLLLMVGKNKGEWSGGRHQLAEYLEMNPNTLYSVLGRLESNNIINRSANNRYTIITVVNWHKYQSSSTSTSTGSTPARQQRVNSASTSQQHYNKKENEKKKENRENNFPNETPGSERRATASPGKVEEIRSVLEAKGILRKKGTS